jgi:hypothetical protein
LKNFVRVYAWSQDGHDPKLHNFALLPDTKTFKVTESILRDLALFPNNNTTSPLPWLLSYDKEEGFWVGFKPGQVFDAEMNQHCFFFKWEEVNNCLGFEGLVQKKMSGLHIWDNLAGEQSYVKDALSQCHSAALVTTMPHPPPTIPTSKKSTSSLSSSPSAVPYIIDKSHDVMLNSSDDEICSLPPIVPSVKPQNVKS